MGETVGQKEFRAFVRNAFAELGSQEVTDEIFNSEDEIYTRSMMVYKYKDIVIAQAVYSARKQGFNEWATPVYTIFPMNYAEAVKQCQTSPKCQVFTLPVQTRKRPTS